MARPQWIHLLGFLAICLQGVGTLAASRGKATNSVEDVDVSCTADKLHLTVRLSQPFLGLLHARGFPAECVAQGSGERVITLSLPTTGCGVRLAAVKGDALRWVVAVDVQFDRQLQLAADERRLVSCPAPHEDVVSSDTLPLQERGSSSPELDQPSPPQALRADRVGRRGSEVDFDHSPIPSPAGGARFWMVLETVKSRDSSTALVGEPVAMAIKAKLSAGLSMRVTDCRAHDGAGDSPQRLSDSWGCPLEPQILPQLNYTSVNGALHMAATKFPAFKFPDRESLHMQCALMICRGQCPVARCPDGSWPMETHYSSLPTGKIIGRLEVFNSIRVIAPGIELEASDIDIDNFSNAAQRGESLGRSERSLCISPSRMALALAALGAVLVCAVGAALYSAMLGRQRKSSPRIVSSMLTTGRPLPYVRVVH